MSDGSEPERTDALDETFGSVLEALPVSLFAYDAESLQILEVNAEASRQYGYTRDEFVALTIADIRPPEDVPAMLETVRVPHETGHRSGVWRHRRKDRSVMDMDVVSSPVTFRGRPARLVVAIDVTERARTEDDLRASEERLRALVGSIDEVLFEFDGDGTCRNLWTANPGLLVAPQESMIGRTIVEILGEAHGLPLQEAVARVVATGRAETIEYVLDLAEGTQWFLARIARIAGIGDALASVSFLARDITVRVRAEGAVREMEERLRTLVEQLPAVVFVEYPTTDPNKAFFEYLSPQAEQVFGYSTAEFMARPELFGEVLHPEDRDRVIAANARAEETGEPFDQEYRVVAQDGRVVWVHSSSRLMRDEEGYPKHWLGLALDVSPQKEAEEALHLAEDRYRTLVEQLPAVSFALVRGEGPSDMYFTFLSPQVERIFGYPAEDLLGDPARFAQVLHPDDRDHVVAALGRASQEEAPFDSIFRIVRPDGSVAWLQGRADPILDEEGRPVFWQGVALDVTEQRSAAEALRQVQERYRLVVDNTLDLISLIEPDGTIVFASPSHERILGTRPEELVGRNVLDLPGPADIETSRAALAEAIAGRRPPSFRLTMTARNGRPVVLESSGGIPILDEHGEVRLVLGITRDVTEQVRAERERENLLSRLVSAQEEERARIAADIHDDPIQAIVAVGMQLDLLAEHTDDPDLLARVERLRTGVQHAIDRLRRQLFELSPPSLESGLGTAVVELAARAEEGPDFELRIDDRTKKELPIEARTAAFRIVQEAFANVRKHARARNVIVRLEERDGGMVVTVEDDGIGIAAGMTSEAGHLGLRGMQERATLMGGWLEFGPRPGGGTYVELWLPGSSRR